MVSAKENFVHCSNSIVLSIQKTSKTRNSSHVPWDSQFLLSIHPLLHEHAMIYKNKTRKKTPKNNMGQITAVLNCHIFSNQRRMMLIYTHEDSNSDLLFSSFQYVIRRIIVANDNTSCMVFLFSLYLS